MAKAIHELLHTMGIEHTSAGLRDPGTGTASAATLMGPGCLQADPVPCPHPETLQNDDVKVIDTLFSAQSGGSCAFLNNYELIAALP